MRSPKTILALGAVALVVFFGATAGPTLFPAFASADSPGETGWLGVSLQDLNANLRDAMGFEPRQRGALITNVIDDSPADEAGLRARDLVTRVNGQSIRSTDDLIDSVDDLRAGQKIELTILRGDRERKLSATLGSRPPRSAAPDVREHFLPETDEDGNRSWTWNSDEDDDGDRRVWVFRGDDDSSSEESFSEDSASEEDSDDSSDRWFSRDDDSDSDSDSDRWFFRDDDSDSDSDSDSDRVNRWFSRDDDSDKNRGRVNRWFSRDDDDKDRGRQRIIIRDGDVAFGGRGGFLGVATMSLNEQLAEYFGTDEGEGVLVTEVREDAPADHAGLRAGDVILAVDGDEVGSPGELRKAIRGHDAEETVEIRILRSGDQRTIRATLGDARDLGDLGPLRGLGLDHFRVEIPDLEGLKGLEGLRGLEALEGLRGLEALEGLHGLEALEGLHDLEDLDLHIPGFQLHIKKLDELHENLEGMHEELQDQMHELHKQLQEEGIHRRSRIRSAGKGSGTI